MDTRQLQYFISVAEHLSFTTAAKHLYVSQPSLSQQIAELEKQIGARLFIRNRHSVALTAAGTVLLKEAKAIIARSLDAIRMTRAADAGVTGNLRIGILGHAERRILPRITANFHHKYPQINLVFEYFSLSGLDEALQHAQVDLGFTLVLESTSLPQISFKKIITDSLCLVVPHSHELANEPLINYSHIPLIAKETIIFEQQPIASRGYENLLRICFNRCFSPNVLQVPNLPAVLLSVECGLGISIQPSVIPKTYRSPYIRYIDILGNDTRIDLVAAWHKKNSNPSISLFLQELEAAKKPIDNYPILQTTASLP